MLGRAVYFRSLDAGDQVQAGAAVGRIVQACAGVVDRQVEENLQRGTDVVEGGLRQCEPARTVGSNGCGQPGLFEEPRSAYGLLNVELPRTCARVWAARNPGF